MRKIGFILGCMTLALGGSLAAGCLNASQDCGLFFNCGTGGAGAGGSGGGGAGGGKPTCFDEEQNGDESDVDCGHVCPDKKCEDGKLCGEDDDCKSGVCTGGKCFPSGCGDTVQNGDETDIDCGGSCPQCDPHLHCEVNEDCKGNVCEGNECQENCDDTILDNGETDIDCGGTTGCKKCDNGQKCNVDGDCNSTFCPNQDGVCCSAACDGECMACIEANTGTSDGTCAPVIGGKDPDNECEPEDPTTCGNSDGNCDGNGACRKQAAGMACGSAQSCSGGIQTNQDVCDGAGMCTEMGVTACGLYNCVGMVACGMSCAAETDCVMNAYCDVNQQCQQKKPNGDGCGGPNECTSGFCVDGVCCNVACGSACQSCNLMGLGGTCSNVPSGEDPNNDCAGALVCDGTTGFNACKQPNGTGCGANGVCASGHCKDFVCCDNTCSGTCESCSLVGTVGTCTNVPAGKDPDNECGGPTPNCNGSGACLDANGDPCGNNNECTSDFCVDGVCCDTNCTGLCKSCNLVGTVGTCTNVPLGQDPYNECGGSTAVCNGGGACVKGSNGDPCGGGSECVSNFCVDGVCCDTNCMGLCKSCNLMGTIGICTNIPFGQDPDDECSGINECNGAGACIL